ncbi:MAG: 4Fe-4S dicluster domain-containing protein [Clostridia bacterium]|nr:4Fe-4S dicluster domain-containing protein [Clostridia bacterium]
MKKIALTNIDSLYQQISSSQELYLPVVKAGSLNFAKYEQGCKVDINTLQTIKSPKDLFFPQSEDIMSFKTSGKQIEIIDERVKKDTFVIFGVRACDNKSFEVLDKVFLQEPVDSMYKNKRDNAVIVTLACNNPQKSCFCKTFDIDASSPKGDVEGYVADGFLYLDAKTEKGAKLLESLNLEDSSDTTVVENLKKDIVEKIIKLPFAKLNLDVFKGENLMTLFDRPEWEEMSKACLGCGTCTFVCPTCQCFDVKDFKTNEGVRRFRCWDSCMYSEFTKMAAENPRKNQMQRFRQRFMHKLVYYPSNNDGLYSCVGCGRCVKKCPQSLNIVKVIKKLGGKDND